MSEVSGTVRILSFIEYREEITTILKNLLLWLVQLRLAPRAMPLLPACQGSFFQLPVNDGQLVQGEEEAVFFFVMLDVRDTGSW